MKTYHIYKTNCFGSSRLSLQASWDRRPIFIHKSDVIGPKIFGGKEVESKDLRLSSLVEAVRSCRGDEKSTFVFHAQSSLPYLFFLGAVGVATNTLGRISLVYDVHDLHEKHSYDAGILKNIAGHIRYAVLGGLEALVIRYSSVSVMTVSDGLKRIMSDKYGRQRIKVVRSVPLPVHDGNKLALSGKIPNTILFFGSRDRVPIDVFDAIGAAGMNIHIYGRELTKAWYESHSGRVTPDHVRFMGAYAPDNLDFILNYSFTIIYKHGDISDNFIYSLPNKFFQSLCFGSAVLVSEDAAEMQVLMRPIAGSVICITSDVMDKLDEIVRNSLEERTHTFYQDVISRMSDLHLEAKLEYGAVMGARSAG